jgi:hypothetical protein
MWPCINCIVGHSVQFGFGYGWPIRCFLMIAGPYIMHMVSYNYTYFLISLIRSYGFNLLYLGVKSFGPCN